MDDPRSLSRLSKPHGMSRRALLQGSALAAAGLGLSALTGCAPFIGGTSTRVDELAFWNLLSGGDGMRMKSMVDTVNGELEGARIKQTVLSWGSPYYTKLAMASAGGRAPDLGIMHLSRLAGYAPGGLLDEWDIGRLEPYGVTERTFSGPTWDRMQFDGGLYAIALDSHAFVRFFNPEVADAAGVLDSDGKFLPTATLDEFIEQADAMRGVTGELGLSYGWLGSPDQMWRLFWTFYTQQGAEMISRDGGVDFEQDAFIGSIEAMQKLLGSDAVNRRSDGGFAYSTFTSGQSGEYFCGVWELPSLQDSGVPLDASPIPNLFGTEIDAVWGDSHAFVLPHQAAPDEVRREKTYEAVSLLLKASLPWGSAGHTPAYLPVVAEPEFEELMPNANYSETADYLQYDPALPFAGSGSNWQSQFGQSVQAALLGTASSQDALQSFTEMTNTFVRQSVL